MTIKDDKTLEAPAAGEPEAGASEVKTPAADEADDKNDGFTELDPLLEGDEEEEVTIKRGSLKKFRTSAGNYQKVAVAAKKRGKEETPKPIAAVSAKAPEDQNAPVSRKEFFLGNEKTAIAMATVPTKDDDDEAKALKAEINDNWDEVKKSYVSRHGKATAEDVYKDILDAHAVWKRTAPAPKTDDEDKGAKAALAQSQGFGGRTGKPAPGERKRVIPNVNSQPSTWYGEPKKK